MSYTLSQIETFNSKQLKAAAKDLKISRWYDMNSDSLREAILAVLPNEEVPEEIAEEVPEEAPIEELSIAEQVNQEFEELLGNLPTTLARGKDAPDPKVLTTKKMRNGTAGVCNCCHVDYNLEEGYITDYFRVRKSPYRLYYDCKSCISKANAKKNKVKALEAEGWEKTGEGSFEGVVYHLMAPVQLKNEDGHIMTVEFGGDMKMS